MHPSPAPHLGISHTPDQPGTKTQNRFISTTTTTPQHTNTHRQGEGRRNPALPTAFQSPRRFSNRSPSFSRDPNPQLPLSQLSNPSLGGINGERPQDPGATDPPETPGSHLAAREPRRNSERATYHRVPLCHRPRHLVQTVQRAKPRSAGGGRGGAAGGQNPA